MAETFFVDGKYLTPEQCKEIFGIPKKLENRQRKCLEMIEGNLIIDIGCYAGGFIAEAQNKFPGKKFIGVDYSYENIKIAKFIYPNLQNHFINMSVYTLGFEDNSVDCITFQEVIEHLEGAAMALKEINRVLKPGGTLIVSTNNAYYWRDKWLFYFAEIKNRLRSILHKPTTLKSVIYFDNVEWNRHIYCWTPSTLMTLLNESFAY